VAGARPSLSQMLADFTRRVSRKTLETRARQGFWRFGSRIQVFFQADD